MRFLNDNELDSVSGGKIDSAATTTANVEFDMTANDMQMADFADSLVTAGAEAANDFTAGSSPLFSIGDFEVTTSGSLWEGAKTAAVDCLVGSGLAKVGNEFGGTSNIVSSAMTSSYASVIGCTVGVGAGIIRDLGN